MAGNLTVSCPKPDSGISLGASIICWFTAQEKRKSCAVLFHFAFVNLKCLQNLVQVINHQRTDLEERDDFAPSPIPQSAYADAQGIRTFLFADKLLVHEKASYAFMAPCLLRLLLPVIYMGHIPFLCRERRRIPIIQSQSFAAYFRGQTSR
jgi:hypothetical protein